MAKQAPSPTRLGRLKPKKLLAKNGETPISLASTPQHALRTARGSSRPPLERMVQLHQQIQAGKFPNCRKLAETLEVSSKTIQRDIEFMRDRLNLPIEYDQLQFGFYYTEPVASFPNIEVSEGEIVALFVAQLALAQYRGTSFEKPLHAAFEKITDGLRDTITFEWSSISSAFSFRGVGATIADLEQFEKLSKAVLRSREIEFEYKKLRSATYEWRRVQPYHLACVENQWYLFAFDLARHQLRTFALPRMRRAKDSKMSFKRPADFSISKHLCSSFGVFSGNGDFTIRIRFDEFAARLVGERQWHASQKIKPLSAGEIDLTLELGNLEEIERWILSWGSHAKVMEPAELADRIKKAALDISKAYSA